MLGNHTDYNEGYILSAAIDKYCVVVGRRVLNTNACSVQSSLGISKKRAPVNFLYRRDVPLVQLDGDDVWVNYVLGVVDQFRKKNINLDGFEAFVDSNVPLGAGVSSSAALEMATAKLLQQLFPEACSLSQLDLVLMCKAAENNFVGMGCGVLDQFSSGMGKADHLIFLDCRDLICYENISMGDKAVFVLANTHAEHALVDGQYNKLRECCEEAARHFKEKVDRRITHLRDVPVGMFEAEQDQKGNGAMQPERWAEVMQRAKHIVYENERVLKSATALKNGDLATLGKAMSQSHLSSKVDFRNSCDQLDTMVECAEDLPGFLGGRLMGGGFGGCTINLVEVDKVEKFSKELCKRYKKATGIAPSAFTVAPGDGAYAGTFSA